VAKQREGKARYRSGGIYRQRYADGKLGGIFWARWREVIRRPDGVVTYVQHRESTHTNDPDKAEDFLRKKLIAQGGPRPKTIDTEKVTYEDIRDYRLARAVSDKKRSLIYGRDGKPTLPTLRRLDAFFGGWKAADITTDDIERFRKQGTDDGLSEARMNRYVSELSKMFHDAVKKGLIERMPAYFPKTNEPNEAQGAVFIEEKWYAPLRKALDEPLRSAFVLGFHYAVRVYEMRRLRWRDVDAKKRIVILPGSITKTGQPRVVPLPSDFGLRPGKPDDFVFPIGDFRDEWRAACIKIGVGHYECRECRARCKGRMCPEHGKRALKGMVYVGPQLRHTRHTAVRNMVDKGLNRDRAKAISGHKTDSMFSRYNIGLAEDLEEARRLVEQKRRKG
jgi:integrase